ncbi:MAG: hypothetical protein LBQ94_07660 [Treponema sp.]|nr:hypothetical protein [Treponema sp.]
MKKFSLVLAMLALVLVFGLSFLSCDMGSTSGSGGIPAALVAKWYDTQAQANAGGNNFALEITSNGRYIFGSNDLPCSVSGNTITVYTTGGNYVNFAYTYTLSGTELTLVRTGSSSSAGTSFKVYKKAN